MNHMMLWAIPRTILAVHSRSILYWIDNLLGKNIIQKYLMKNSQLVREGIMNSSLNRLYWRCLILSFTTIAHVKPVSDIVLNARTP